MLRNIDFSRVIQIFGAGAAVVLTVAVGSSAVWAEESGDHKIQAHETDSSAKQSEVCAVIERWDGSVEVLSPNRKDLIDLKENHGIPCGSWISTSVGKISLKHASGVQVRIAPRSFVEFSNENGKAGLTLFKGAVLSAPSDGVSGFYVMTANAKAQIQSGAGIVIYGGDNQKTQLISLAGTSDLRNRFESERAITVQGGEMTSLDLSLMRVVPTIPKAVATTSLDPLLGEFALNEKERGKFIVQARNRAERQWAYTVRIQSNPQGSAQRMPASSYQRHAPMDVGSENVKASKRKLMDELKTLQPDDT